MKEAIITDVAIQVPERLGLPNWDFNNEVWTEGKLFDLDVNKQDKIKLLDKQCNHAALGTFVSSAMGSEHIYILDMEAQMNLAGAKQAFQDLLISNIDWNTRDAGVLYRVLQQKC
jgi:hypothetical protein